MCPRYEGKPTYAAPRRHHCGRRHEGVQRPSEASFISVADEERSTPAATGRSGPFLRSPLPSSSRAQRNGLVDMDSPVWRYPARGPGHRLVYRVMYRWGEPRAGAGLAGGVVPEPVLARLETLHDWMAGGLPVCGGVLRWRGVAAADVSTLGAAAQVNPPPAEGVALDAAGPAWRHRRIYAWYLSHLCAPCLQE